MENNEFLEYYHNLLKVNKDGSKYYLRDIQLICIDILKEVMRVCELNKVEYFLEAGTLLGCARHQGFIPWDDDLDLTIRRENYQAFSDAMNKDLDKSKYIFSCLENNRKHNINGPAIKIRRKGTWFPQKWNWFTNASGQNEIFIDVFVYDNASLDEAVLKKYRKKAIVSAVIQQIFVILCIQSKRIKRKHVKQSEKYGDLNKDSNYFCSRLTWIATKSWTYDKRDFFPLATGIFEGLEVPIPHNLDTPLTIHYGNWKEFPPYKKRGVKHYSARRLYLEPGLVNTLRESDPISQSFKDLD